MVEPLGELDAAPCSTQAFRGSSDLLRRTDATLTILLRRQLSNELDELALATLGLDQSRLGLREAPLEIAKAQTGFVLPVLASLQVGQARLQIVQQFGLTIFESSALLPLAVPSKADENQGKASQGPSETRQRLGLLRALLLCFQLPRGLAPR